MRVSIKNIVVSDIRLAVVSAIAWGSIMPASTQLKGLMSMETIGLFLILTTSGMELLKLLTRKTTFKTSTLVVIVYDVFFMVSMLAGMLFLDQLSLAVLLSSLLVPYALLTKNAGNKFKILIGKSYPDRIVERIYISLSLFESRSVLVAVGITSLLSTIGSSQQEILWLFYALNTVAVFYAIRNYRKYYKHLT